VVVLTVKWVSLAPCAVSRGWGGEREEGYDK
jgi:hypothetical protein